MKVKALCDMKENNMLRTTQVHTLYKNGVLTEHFINSIVYMNYIKGILTTGFGEHEINMFYASFE